MPKHSASYLPLSFEDYGRMSRVITAVLRAFRKDPATSCAYYAMVGTYLLEQFHQKATDLVAGGAMYVLTAEPMPEMLYYGPCLFEDGTPTETWHCWIECDGHVIDLMAPIFREVMNPLKGSRRLPRRMLQRSLADSAATPALVKTLGDFRLTPSEKHTEDVFEGLARCPDILNIIRICSEWYVRAPKRIDKSITMESDKGQATAVQLPSFELVGKW